MDQFGRSDHPERLDGHLAALRAHRARRHVLLHDGHRVSGDGEDDRGRVPPIRRVVQSQRAEGANPHADHQERPGLDQDGHTGPAVHHSEQSGLFGHLESGRGRVSGHLSDQDPDDGYFHGDHSEA